MRYRKSSRRQRNLSGPVYRPQVTSLEQRLPLGDALIGPLLAASWLGAHEQEATEETESLQNKSISGWRSQTQSLDSLWAGVAGRSSDTVADGEMVALAGRPSRPVSSGLEDVMDNNTAPSSGQRGSGGNLSERPVSLVETPVAPPGMETTSLTPYFGRSGRAENVDLLQALASVRLAGSGHGGHGQETVPQRGVVSKEQVQANYGTLPLSFEANVGQANASVQFLAHGPGYGLYLTETEAVMVISPKRGIGVGGQDWAVGQAAQPDWFGQARQPDLRSAPEAPATVVRMQVLGGNASPRVMGEDPLPGKVNYFLGNDSSQWHSNISTFGKVEYQQVYPGIDLVYYGSGQQLEYDFVVSPGADPSLIRLGFTGADDLAVNGQGDLVLHAAGQEIVQHKPMVYQEANGIRQEIASQFVLFADGSPLTPNPSLQRGEGRVNEVGFQLAPYDASRPLVIDPVLSYSTYLGGSAEDTGDGIAVDPNTGDALVTGRTNSTNFPTANPFQPNLGGGMFDAFVARLSADGSALVFSTYLGGNGLDIGNGIAVDPTTGDALVTGVTTSRDFPTANPFQPNNGGQNAFVTRLSADGSALIFSTYLGGSGPDQGEGIAVDPTTGDVLVTGGTASPNFPTANALQPFYGGGTDDVFVTRLSADGSALVYSTYLGGSANDVGISIAVDPTTGDALVTGRTTSRNFPTANPLQLNLDGFSNGFVARVSADGSALVFSTYLGGSGNDQGNGIAVDPTTGDVLVTGVTTSTNFPTVNPLQPNLDGRNNAFVARVSADGSALIFSTYLGGSADDVGISIAVDPTTGDALVTGFTTSTDFPTVNPLQPKLGGSGSNNAFVARVSADGSTLVSSTYLGGNRVDFGTGITVDPATGDVLVTGATGSPNFPTTANALQPNLRGVYNAFVARIS